MSLNREKTELKKKPVSKPKYIAEGILLYPDGLELGSETISQIADGGYIVAFGKQSFVLNIIESD